MTAFDVFHGEPASGADAAVAHVGLWIGKTNDHHRNTEYTCDTLGSLTISGGRSNRLAGAPDGAVCAFTLHIERFQTPELGDYVHIFAQAPRDDPAQPALPRDGVPVFVGIITDIAIQHDYGDTLVHVAINATDTTRIAASTAVTRKHDPQPKTLQFLYNGIAAAWEAHYIHARAYGGVTEWERAPANLERGYWPAPEGDETHPALDWLRTLAETFGYTVGARTKLTHIGGATPHDDATGVFALIDEIAGRAGAGIVRCQFIDADPGPVFTINSADYVNTWIATYKVWNATERRFDEAQYVKNTPVLAVYPDQARQISTEVYDHPNPGLPPLVQHTIDAWAALTPRPIGQWSATGRLTTRNLEGYSDADRLTLATDFLATVQNGCAIAAEIGRFALEAGAQPTPYFIESTRLTWLEDGWQVDWVLSPPDAYANTNLPTDTVPDIPPPVTAPPTGNECDDMRYGDNKYGDCLYGGAGATSHPPLGLWVQNAHGQPGNGEIDVTADTLTINALDNSDTDHSADLDRVAVGARIRYKTGGDNTRTAVVDVTAVAKHGNVYEFTITSRTVEGAPPTAAESVQVTIRDYGTP